MMIFGIFPFFAITRKRETVSSLPTISDILEGLYFSTQGRLSAGSGFGARNIDFKVEKRV
jgi:hypothetical protein